MPLPWLLCRFGLYPVDPRNSREARSLALSHGVASGSGQRVHFSFHVHRPGHRRVRTPSLSLRKERPLRLSLGSTDSSSFLPLAYRLSLLSGRVLPFCLSLGSSGPLSDLFHVQHEGLACVCASKRPANGRRAPKPRVDVAVGRFVDELEAHAPQHQTHPLSKGTRGRCRSNGMAVAPRVWGRRLILVGGRVRIGIRNPTVLEKGLGLLDRRRGGPHSDNGSTSV
eukprot:scaffold177_cov334-Pavlova_lutheri.AAC.103